ncbi:zinc-binding dehydrogenase [Aliamphritea spongicola]|nr:zinc-binding dehydrogenase [Aliamphritea spongicola]
MLGTASMHNHEFLGDLGVDRVIDYQHKRVPEHAKDIDLIIDCVGGESGIEALECLKPDGRLVTLPSVTKDIVIAAGQAQNRHVEAIRVMPDAAQLEQIVALYADDILRLQINGSYQPDQLEEAFELSATGHVCGKLILSFA